MWESENRRPYEIPSIVGNQLVLIGSPYASSVEALDLRFSFESSPQAAIFTLNQLLPEKKSAAICQKSIKARGQSLGRIFEIVPRSKHALILSLIKEEIADIFNKSRPELIDHYPRFKQQPLLLNLNSYWHQLIELGAQFGGPIFAGNVEALMLKLKQQEERELNSSYQYHRDIITGEIPTDIIWQAKNIDNKFGN